MALVIIRILQDIQGYQIYFQYLALFFNLGKSLDFRHA